MKLITLQILKVHIGIQVAYRKKVPEGQTANNWIIVDDLNFEYVENAEYEVRVRDVNGNEKINTIAIQNI